MESLVCIFVLSFLYVTATSSQIISNVFESNISNQIVKTIVVDHYGKGDFRTVQSAIDAIPLGNDRWIKIYIRKGIYNEKVFIPAGKSKIFMQGNKAFGTIIQYKGGGDAIASATCTVDAEFFVAMYIAFKNTYNQEQPMTPYYDIKVAPAVVLRADKAAFFNCEFFSIQDTLGDIKGRHYFEQCHIKGGIDYIWGGGQSIYQSCVLDVFGVVSPNLQETESKKVNGGLISGCITAQSRLNDQDTSGFVFNGCSIIGPGRAYLGRPNQGYARVFFCNTNMADVIDPLGWNASSIPVDKLTFAEFDCNGSGAKKERRVPWEKNLSRKEAAYFTNPKTFLDKDGWIETLPPH